MPHRHSRTLVALLICAAAVAGGLIALGSTSSSSAVGASRHPAASNPGWGSPAGRESTARPRSSRSTVAVHSSALGPILVNSAGRTLYGFTRDRRDHDSCVEVSGCTSAWPIATVRGRERAARGVKPSLLGSITLKGGIRQITYAGHPLYTYAGDGGTAETGYVGASSFGGVWKAVKPSGALEG